MKLTISQCAPCILAYAIAALVVASRIQKSNAQGPMGGIYGRKITPKVVCHACHACVVEVEKILELTATSNRREVDVIDAIAGICDPKYFKIYDYPPLKMARACQKVLDASDELLERLFLTVPRLSAKEIEEKGCMISCKNIDRRKQSHTNMGSGGSVDPDVYFNGIPQKFGSLNPVERPIESQKADDEVVEL